MKTVSIIIPVYQVAAYLPQCLDSVLGQTYHDLEILLIDDGSTDGSGEICEKYAAADHRIRLVHQGNAGAANAKNKGLDLATGGYIAFADSDDYVEPVWIEKMVNALEEAGADAAECSFLKEYTDHTEQGNDETFANQLFTGREYMSQYLDRWTNSLFWNKLFRAELTKETRFRKERRCIDDEFYTYKVIGTAQKVVRIKDVLYHYRQRASSAVFSPEKAFQKTEDAIEIIQERYHWISKRYPELKKYFLRHDVNNLHFFAQEYLFSEETFLKFQRNARFCVKECIKTCSGGNLLKDSFLLFRHPKKIMLKRELSIKENTKGLFI